MKTIYQRLDEIYPLITSSRFLERKGLANEIGFYIFDYAPQYEMANRSHVKYLQDKINSGDYGFKIKEVDLYDLMIEILQNKGYLDKTFDMEAKKGTESIVNPIKKTLRLTTDKDLIVEAIQAETGKDQMIFLTGIGKAWPLIRSHTVLNSLHAVVEDMPLIMFFPGTYDGLELRLFDEIKDDNYYRAFRLVEHK